MKVKGTARVWTTNQWNCFNTIETLIKDGCNDRAVASMSYSDNDMSNVTGWSEVGIATITVEFFPREAIVSKQIEGLREQLRQHRVNAELAERAILDQISNLTAITA